MALAYRARLDLGNDYSTSSEKTMSELIGDGGTPEILYYVYDQPASATQTYDNWRTYCRSYNTSTHALGTEYDVSGAETGGARFPLLARLLDGTLICAYQTSYPANNWDPPAFVVKIRESVDNGATWTTALAFEAYTRHALMGLKADGNNCIMLTKSNDDYADAVAGGIALHKRVSVGVWTSSVIYSWGATSPPVDSWHFRIPPQQMLAYHGTSICMIGTRRVPYHALGGPNSLDRVSVYRSSDSGATWQEHVVGQADPTSVYGMDRFPQLVRGPDNRLRAFWIMPAWTYRTPEWITGATSYSDDFGQTWSPFVTPPDFYYSTDPADGSRIYWTGATGLAVDMAGNWFITPVEGTNGYKIHQFKGNDVGYFFYMNAVLPVNGNGTQIDWQGMCCPAAFSGGIHYRAICSYDTVNSWYELLLLDDTTAGATRSTAVARTTTNLPKRLPN